MERRFPITLLRVVLRMPKAIHLKDGRLLNRLFGPHGMKTETKLRTPAQGAIPSKGTRSVRTRFRGPIPSTWVVRMRAILAPTGQGDVPTKATSGVAILLPIRRTPLREQCSISVHSFRMPPQQKSWSRKQKPICGWILSLLSRNLLFWRCRFC